ncbi:V-type ATP synthase subunit I [Leptospira sp. GIMC2001]|uniref:V-type ATP synthase subunit I n=1 Tax=Leptospira sp. GIMC2001 TaxID=1513297 RepID=UPI00234B1C25|nr:hypothetical protein [Leptospira sp. GIMC2001]WCL49072.1 hypothetical protein O4O04_17550 [Leptospira sp. GIMC2001]
MSKIHFVLHTGNKKRNLAKLQNLGLVHIETSELKNTPKLSILERKKKRFLNIITKISELSKSSKKQSSFPNDVTTKHQRILYLEKRISLLDEKILALDEMKMNLKTMEPWGDIDWNRIDQLRAHGIHIRFLVTTQNILTQKNLDEAYFIVHSDSKKVYLIAFDYKKEPEDYGFEEIQLSRNKLSELRTDIDIIIKSIFDDKEYLSSFHFFIEKLQHEIITIENRMDFELAKSSMFNSTNGLLFGVTGWVPTKLRDVFILNLNSEKIAYLFTDTTIDDDIPILLSNNMIARFFEPITKIFSLPKYTEIDPTVFFAPFFTIFFGLSLGDVGYGALLTIASVLFYFRASLEWKKIAALSIILSISTMVCGVFVNSVFGAMLFRMNGSDSYLLDKGAEFAIFAPIINGSSITYPIMSLALMLGFIQLSLGLMLQSVNRILDSNRFIYGMKPISVIMILWGGMIWAVHNDILDLGFNGSFKIGNIAIGSWLTSIPSEFGMFTFWIGLISFFLFHDPRLSWVKRPVFGIWEAYQLVTGFLGDFLSYIRLFALGLASGLLGNAFNQVAFMILPNGDINTPLFVLTIIILILGHCLNLGLGILGSFVHPLRLTFVEFYKSMNFTGGGKEFKPFALQK